MPNTVWRVAEKRFDVDGFLNKYYLSKNAVVFREGEVRRNGKVVDKSGFNISVSGNIDSKDHVSELGHFIERNKEAFDELRKREISSTFDVGCFVGASDQIMVFVKFPTSLLGMLVSQGIELEFSAYFATDDENEI